MLHSVTEYYKVLHGIAKNYKVLQSITKCYKDEDKSSASTWTNFLACFSRAKLLFEDKKLVSDEVAHLSSMAPR